MKDRVVKLGLDKSLQHPTIVDEAPYLNYGLEESIEEWTKEVLHPPGPCWGLGDSEVRDKV